MSDKKEKILLEVTELSKFFPVYDGIVFKRQIGDIKAVDNVNFHINKGETLGLVGESGCGKTTTGRLILHLEELTHGAILFDGKDITHPDKNKKRALKKEMQVIFQDPFGSLDPRMTAREIIGQPLIINKMNGSKGEYIEKINHLLEVVGLNPGMAERYPHEFSGGQRQRIGIARSISLNPKLIICDEPVSALDVSIQSQILNLLIDLQKEFNLSYLFIAHDLAVVKHISDRIAIMYLGKIVESGVGESIYRTARHPYTQSLISAIPVPDPHHVAHRQILVGDVPSPINPPSGCNFHTRCPQAMEVCKQVVPHLSDEAQPVSCLLYEASKT